MPSNEQASYLDDLDALEASQQREEAFDDYGTGRIFQEDTTEVLHDVGTVWIFVGDNSL